MKIYIAKDEYYPWFVTNTDPKKFYDVEATIPSKRLDWIKKTTNEFHKVNLYLQWVYSGKPKEGKP